MTDTISLEASQGRKIFARFLESIASAERLKKFDALTRIYFDVNDVINISALRNLDDVYIKHYLDSAYPVKYFFGEVCDVGCGGGFPSIPLAILTKCHILGADGVGKKLALIKKAAQTLKLDNLDCIHARSEELTFQGKTFDTVCARALADTTKAIKLCSPLVKKGGNLILYKTQNDLPAQLNDCKKNNLSLKNTIDYTLPETDIKRRLFIYTKN